MPNRTAAHPHAPLATITLPQGVVLTLYTGPDEPPHGNAGDWWLPKYPNCITPHTHDGTGWDQAAPTCHQLTRAEQSDLVALIFAGMAEHALTGDPAQRHAA